MCYCYYYEKNSFVMLYIHPFNYNNFISEFKSVAIKFYPTININTDNDLCCFEVYSKKYNNLLQSVILRYFNNYHEFKFDNNIYCSDSKLLDNYLILSSPDLNNTKDIYIRKTHNQYCFGDFDKINVFVSKKYANELLLSFQFECCSIIGIYELYSVYTFLGLPLYIYIINSFPFDYIDIPNSSNNSNILDIIKLFPENYSIVRGKYIKSVLPSYCGIEDLLIPSFVRINIKVEKGGKEGYGKIYYKDNVVGLVTNIFYNTGCARMTGIGYIKAEVIHLLVKEEKKEPYHIFIEYNNNGNKIESLFTIAYE